MSYESREISNEDGAPISFYEIEWGSTIWRYTSAESNQTITIPVGVDNTPTEVEFEALPISDDGMVQGGSSNNDMTVTAPPNIPLTDLFQSTPPSGEIKLTIRRAHEGDPVAFIYWKGLITNVKRDPGGAFIQIIGMSILGLFQSEGLRLAWVRGCPHILYDDECRVDPEDFAHETEIISMTGNSITVAGGGGKPEGWFTGGYVEWEANADGTLDRRGIMASNSFTEFVLLGSTYRLEVGMTVRLYPGCDLTTETCETKFNNLPNYGGCEQMTGKNPFDGTSII